MEIMLQEKLLKTENQFKNVRFVYRRTDIFYRSFEAY